MNNREIRQYDVVRVLAIYRQLNKSECSPGIRLPEIDDIATVIEVYEKPTVGYELESVDNNGETNYLVTIAPEDMDFEIVGNLNMNIGKRNTDDKGIKTAWKCKCPRQGEGE